VTICFSSVHLFLAQFHTCTIFDQVNQLKSITWLDLSGNKFGGRLPRSLGTCEHLQVLDLSNNAFNGNVPTTLGRLMDLKECRLSDNQFSGLHRSMHSTIGYSSSLSHPASWLQDAEVFLPTEGVVDANTPQSTSLLNSSTYRRTPVVVRRVAQVLRGPLPL